MEGRERGKHGEGHREGGREGVRGAGRDGNREGHMDRGRETVGKSCFILMCNLAFSEPKRT